MKRLSLILLAALTLMAIGSTTGLAQTESQSFDTAQAAFDAGWGPSFNNRSEDINTDFGYSDTNMISGNGTGEAGGKFSRIFTEVAFYGDLSIGEFLLDDPLHAEGKMRFDTVNFNGEVIVGFFDATDMLTDLGEKADENSPDHIGIGILEQERARTVVGFGDGFAPHDFDFITMTDGVVYDFVFDWDPDDARFFGQGTLAVTITDPDGVEATAERFFRIGDRERGDDGLGAHFNAFGMMTSRRNNNGDNIVLEGNSWIDDVTYTSTNECVTEQCLNRTLDPPNGNGDPEFMAGGANKDFSVDTQDIIAVLAAAKFETGNPATFAEGDFNDDGVFNTADIIEMLSAGLFETGPYFEPAAVSAENIPEPSSFLLLALGMLAFAGRPARRGR